MNIWGLDLTNVYNINATKSLGWQILCLGVVIEFVWFELFILNFCVKYGNK